MALSIIISKNLLSEFKLNFRKFKGGLKGKKGYGTPSDS